MMETKQAKAIQLEVKVHSVRNGLLSGALISSAMVLTLASQVASAKGYDATVIVPALLGLVTIWYSYLSARKLLVELVADKAA